MSDQIKPDSLDAAYGWIAPSYEWAIQRFDAAESRLQWFLSIVTTVTVAVPVVAQTLEPNPDLASGWFIAALAVFFLGALVAIVSRFFDRTGKIDLTDVAALHDNWLHKDKQTFQKELLRFAGGDLRRNLKTVRNVTYVTGLLSLLFALEAVFFALWLTGG